MNLDKNEENKPQRVSEVLNAAADLINKQGLCKGQMREGALFDDFSGPHCTLGAIETVTGESPGLYSHPDNLAGRTAEILEEYVGLPVHNWNDARSRTKGQVVRKLRKVAKKEAEYEKGLKN